MAGEGTIKGERPGTASLRRPLIADQAPRTRREQLRAGTVAEIRKAARELLATGGPSALTLRGVARAVGMSAAAIYRYYPSLDSLVDALRADLCTDLIAFVEMARDSIPADDSVGRIIQISLALRSWALDQRAEFTLLFRPQRAGPMNSACGQKSDPSYQVGILFLDECTEIWRRGLTTSSAKAPPWGQFDHYLGPWLTERYTGLPAGAVYASLRAWTNLCGLILMEASGYLAWMMAADGQRLLESELADLVRRFT